MVETITAKQLAAKIDDGEQFALIDTRPKESYDAWHVHGAENVPYDPDEGMDQSQLDEIEAVVDGGPIVTICGKGVTSTPFGYELEEAGYDVSIVTGGMREWSKVYETVPIETDSEDLEIVQVQRRAKGCLGYVIGSRSAGEAAVVDATRQTDQFKVAAQDEELTVEYVLDTHIHADHISGGRSLAEEIGLPYHLGAPARERDVEYEFEPLSDGDTIEFGDVEIRALHTPGHTSDMMNYLVNDEVLLTGDTLFIDSVGRTELQFGEEDATRGAEMLFKSIHETILELPEETRILPGHVSVTEDGRFETGSPGEPITARLGDLREELDLLQLDEDEFVTRLVENAPEKPSNYERIIAINTGQETVEGSEATELEIGPNNCAA